jgi:hypothetical protein
MLEEMNTDKIQKKCSSKETRHVQMKPSLVKEHVRNLPPQRGLVDFPQNI